MQSLCCVKLWFAPENLSVHVEESGRPDSLLGLIEDERRVAPVVRRAWRDYISPHAISSIELHLQPALSYQRRDEAVVGLLWLLHQIRLPKGGPV